jgi:hypothetical protein
MTTGDLSDSAFHHELEKCGFTDIKAGARSEASVYSLNNPYLSRQQKAQIEAVYQFPIGAFEYSLIAVLIIRGFSGWLDAYLVACAVSVPVWAVSWFIPGRLVAAVGTLFAGNFSTIGCLVLAGFAAFHGQYIVAGIAVAIAFLGGVLAIVSPPMWLFSFFSRGITAKYRLAKKMWGTVFPFEKFIE